MEIFNINDFKIVNLDKDNILFFHPATLQIYPLKKNNIIAEVLQTTHMCGWNVAITKFGEDVCQQVISYINRTIANAPSTIYSDIKTDVYQPYFDVVVLPIAGMCNLNCPYCFAQTDGGFNFPNFTEKDIDKVVSFVMDTQINANRKSTSFVFFGGEPLLKFDIIKYTVSYIKQKYPNRSVGFSITTNGTIINDEIIDYFKQNNFLILLSLDGPDNEFNLRKYQDGRKSIDIVMQNIEKLRKEEVSIELRATLINTNPYIVETFDFFEKLQCPFTVVFAYQSENKMHQELSMYNESVLQSIREQLDDLLAYYRERACRGESIYSKIINDAKKSFDRRIGHYIPCTSGRQYFTITADGNIFSCAHLMNNPLFRMGSINNGITSPESYLPPKVTDIVECNKCWARMMCSGGCVTQKISTGMKNTTPMTYNGCELERIKWEFYLKMYYYIEKKM